MRTLVSWLISLVLVGTCYVPEHVSANRIVFNPQQKSQLQQVKTIFIKALALTENDWYNRPLPEGGVRPADVPDSRSWRQKASRMTSC